MTNIFDEYIIEFMELTIKALQDINDNYNSTHHGYGGAQLDIVLSDMKQKVKILNFILKQKMARQ